MTTGNKKLERLRGKLAVLQAKLARTSTSDSKALLAVYYELTDLWHESLRVLPFSTTKSKANSINISFRRELKTIRDRVEIHVGRIVNEITDNGARQVNGMPRMTGDGEWKATFAALGFREARTAPYRFMTKARLADFEEHAREIVAKADRRSAAALERRVEAA